MGTDPKAADRAMWALGDYHKVARDLIWDLGSDLVEACKITTGQRVLDVATGSGNVAIPAAETGAKVIASDLTPELLEAGRREATARNLDLEWVQADAEALPFGDGEFDVVTSSIGVMFAPDHQTVADELLRVCRPGGTVGMINWTPEGMVGDFFRTLAPYAPAPPPGTLPPTMWGSEEYVRDLFGDRVASLDMTRKKLVEKGHFDVPADLCEYYKANFGPTIAVYENVAGEPERLAALDHDFLEFAKRWNRGVPGVPAIFDYEYLLVVARKPGILTT